jgi:hypothetical protein
MEWLRADLRASRAVCSVAYWHHPRFSSGLHGSQTEMALTWHTLFAAGADVVISGHDHSYERFAPMDGAGRADPQRGIRSFVVGSGGRSHYAIRFPTANSEAHNDDTYGVLKLTLGDGRYTWEFLSEAGKTFRDAGTGVCH